MNTNYQYRSVLARLAPILAGLVMSAPNLHAAQTGHCNSPIVVASGDTLSGIAHRCGSSVSALLANNPHIDESGAVRVGDSVYLPAQSELFSAKQLDDMLAPIALHPDVLLAEMLPAATYPLEIVQAARWQERNKNSEVGDDEPWASSVKALTRYPEVLAQMDEDIEWTAQVGEAFLAQPDDVFASIQRLRRLADAAGHLKDNDVQDIVTEPASTGKETIIRIVHADPHYVHVPSYDPHYVYGSSAHTHHHYSGVHFGVGFLLGGWLHHTLDWHHRHLFYQPYHATAYNRYYRYRYYRPYTAYNRSVSNYGHSPYRGLRWRHNSHRYNSFARSSNYNNRYDNKRYNNNRYYEGRRYQGQGYHARRGAGERRLVNDGLNSRSNNSNRNNNRDVRRGSDQGLANNRQDQRQRAADMKTDLWKGQRVEGQRGRNDVRRGTGSASRDRNNNVVRQANVQQILGRSQRLERANRSSTTRTTAPRSEMRSQVRSQVRQSAPRSTRPVQTARRVEPTRSAQPRVERRSVAPRRSEAPRRAERSSRRDSGNRQSRRH